MPTSAQQQLIQRLHTVPGLIEAAAEKLESAAPPAGEWSLRTIVIHLISCDAEIWHPRLQRMLTEDNPQWPYVEPDLALWEQKLTAQTLKQLIAVYKGSHLDMVVRLHTLDEASWARIGTHARYGPMDVAGLLQRIIEHDEEHLTELEKRLTLHA